MRGTELRERLEAERDNLGAALGWALEDAPDAQGAAGKAEIALRLAGGLASFWIRGGNLSEGRNWLERALAKAAPAAAMPARARALVGAGAMAWPQEEYEHSAQLLEEARTLCEQLGDRYWLARVLHHLGIARGNLGDIAAGRSLFEQSLALYRELGYTPGAAASLNNLGAMAQLEGDYESARLLYQEALALARACGYTDTCIILCHLGQIAHGEGDYEAAAGLFREALVDCQPREKPRPARQHPRRLGRSGRSNGSAGARRPALRRRGDVVRGLWLRLARAVSHRARALPGRRPRSARLGGLGGRLHSGQAMSVEEALEYALEENTAE